jgi:hypothetical protein
MALCCQQLVALSIGLCRLLTCFLLHHKMERSAFSAMQVVREAAQDPRIAPLVRAAGMAG